MNLPFKNRAKERLTGGGVICGFGITMAAPGLAQILANSGADLLTIDLEHGALDVADAHALIAATAATACVPTVRVPTAQSWVVKPVLDAGALGIIFPMVRSRADVEAGIAAVLYPPAGKRGIGHHYAPARWNLSAADYLKGANEAILTVILIETREALANIRDLLSVPGLDVATIAIGDLAASLGWPGQPNHPEVQKAVHELETAILDSNVALGGVVASTDDIKIKIERGYRMLVLGFDVGLVQAASGAMVRAVHAQSAGTDRKDK